MSMVYSVCFHEHDNSLEKEKKSFEIFLMNEQNDETKAVFLVFSSFIFFLCFKIIETLEKNIRGVRERERERGERERERERERELKKNKPWKG